MKNFLLISIVSYLGISVSFGQEEYLPIHIDSLHFDSCLVYKVENSKKTIWSKYVYTYEGLPIEKYFYDQHGDLHQYKHYNYDHQGNITELYSQDFPKVWEFADTTSRFAKRMMEEARWHHRKTRFIYEYNDHNQLVKELAYSASYDQNQLTEDDHSFTEENQYDGCGRLTQKVNSWPSSPIRSDTFWYEYDTTGLLILEKKKRYNKNPYFIKYEYNSQGLCIEKETSNYLNKRSNTWVSEYDSIGNLIAYTRFDENMEVVMEEKIYYPDSFSSYYIYKSNTHQTEKWSSVDSLNRVIKNHTKKLNGSGYYVDPPSGKSNYKSKFQYDSLGRVIEEKSYWKQFPINEYEGKTQFEYNSQNQKVKATEFDEKDSITDVTFFYYNSNNQIIKTTDYLSNDTLYGYTYFTYDSVGLVATRKIVDSLGVVELFQTYEYNESGIETGGVFYRGGYYELLESFTYNPDGTSKSAKITEKQGNKIKEEYILNFEYY